MLSETPPPLIPYVQPPSLVPPPKKKKNCMVALIVMLSAIGGFILFIVVMLWIFGGLESSTDISPLDVAKNQPAVSRIEVGDIFYYYKKYKGQERIDYIHSLIGQEVHWIGIVRQVQDTYINLDFGGNNSDFVTLNISSTDNFQTNDMVDFTAVINDVSYFLGIYTIELINPEIISVMKYDEFSKTQTTITFSGRTQTSTFSAYESTTSPTDPEKAYTATYTPKATSTPSFTPTVTMTVSPSITPTPFVTPLKTSTATIAPLVNVPMIIGKNVADVEAIIGNTILITPNDDFDDSTAGGEYRDYQIGDYYAFVSYDKYGIARKFSVLEGLEVENYSLQDWKTILPEFGLSIINEPDKKAPALYTWSNNNGLYVGLAAESIQGYPVWTITIAQIGYE